MIPKYHSIRLLKPINQLKSSTFIRSLAYRNKSNNEALNALFPDEDEDDDIKSRNSMKKTRRPNLYNIEKSWNKLNLSAQDDIISYLQDRMYDDWKTLTKEEKKAIWYVYYGPWGPRQLNQQQEGRYYKHFIVVIGLIGLGLGGYKYMEAQKEKEESN